MILSDVYTDSPIDYSIMMVTATEWELYQGTDSMTINPNTYDSAPHVAKIVLTESGGAITSCKYYVNAVEVTPSFSFSAKGSIGKTGYCLLANANNVGQDMITNSGKWILISAGVALSTTSVTDDTATKSSGIGADQFCSLDSPEPNGSNTFFPPPPAYVRI